jgi:hypothetical protein
MYNNRTTFDYDFSVLELEHEIDCSDYVAPICLPDNTATEATFDDRSNYLPANSWLDSHERSCNEDLKKAFTKTKSLFDSLLLVLHLGYKLSKR